MTFLRSIWSKKKGYETNKVPHIKSGLNFIKSILKSDQKWSRT